MRQFRLDSGLGEITEGPGSPIRLSMVPQQHLTQTNGESSQEGDRRTELSTEELPVLARRTRREGFKRTWGVNSPLKVSGGEGGF